MRLLLVFFYGNVQKGLPTQKGNQLNATPKAGMRCASFRHFFIMTKSNNMKYIFVTGGVVSSLGKGLTAGALGALLEQRGLRVRIQKFDPYLTW